MKTLSVGRRIVGASEDARIGRVHMFGKSRRSSYAVISECIGIEHVIGMLTV